MMASATSGRTPCRRYPVRAATERGLPPSSSSTFAASSSYATSGSHSATPCHDLTALGRWAMCTTMLSGASVETPFAAMVGMFGRYVLELTPRGTDAGIRSNAASMTAGTLSARSSAHAAVWEERADLSSGCAAA
jgi:hypothetical protein